MPTLNFLFLQGPRSPLFARLAQALRQRGHRVYKVHFSAGDAAYWRADWRGGLHSLGQAVNWRGTMASLPAFYADHTARHAITTRTQINGGVHSTAGIKLAVGGAVERLEQGAAINPSVAKTRFPQTSGPVPGGSG